MSESRGNKINVLLVDEFIPYRLSSASVLLS